ncbi:hypothetical protein RvY_04374-2 [Ramazzottius varieornatus]|uniref:Uncharacterized protein n=1 Tax=Ramazzottius varieornatus TaxID=947166 RepID=A0A1D1V0P1_RAMVA|nr:hypothetical protein RvY_04374-2 [Ramazzottius varieornatus]
MDALLPLPPPEISATPRPATKKRKPIPMSFVLVSEDMVFLNKKKPKKQKTPTLPKVSRQKGTKKSAIPVATAAESFPNPNSANDVKTKLISITAIPESAERSSEQPLRKRRKQDNPRRSADQIEVRLEQEIKEEGPSTKQDEQFVGSPCSTYSYEDCLKKEGEDSPRILLKENITATKNLTACGDHWVLNDQDMADLQMFSVHSQIPLDQFLVHFTTDAFHEIQETTKLIQEKEKACGIPFPTGEHAYSLENMKKGHPNDPFYFSLFEC